MAVAIEEMEWRELTRTRRARPVLVDPLVPARSVPTRSVPTRSVSVVELSSVPLELRRQLRRPAPDAPRAAARLAARPTAARIMLRQLGALCAATLAVVALVVGLSALSGGEPVAAPGAPAADAMVLSADGSYVARAGDTMWSIAGRFLPEGRTQRSFVDELIRLNGGVDLAIGQRVRLR